MKLQTSLLSKDTPVTIDQYDEMLGALPPERMTGNAFLVGEPTTHGNDLSGEFGALYDLYFSEDDAHYYGGQASTSDFDALLIPSA